MITEKAYAKINIGLDIVKRRTDGYHDIDTIMQTISLHDEISVDKAKGIIITCTDLSIPTDNTNTVYKAAMVFFKEVDLDYSEQGISINISKNIPSQAGLGGGSSDAAAIIRLLNTIYCTHFSTATMRKLALEVGSDVPFFIEGGTQRAKGRGEILTKLPLFTDKNIVVVMPVDSVSTAYAYSLYTKSTRACHPNMEKIEHALCKNDLKSLSKNIGNTFEGLIFPGKPTIEKARHDILETGADTAAMTGSGAAIYGIYSSNEDATTAYRELKKYYKTYLVKTIGGNA